MAKYLRIGFYALVALAAIVTAGYVYSDNADSGANLGLNTFFILFAIAAGASLLFPLYHMIQSPKAAMKSLVGVAALLVLFFIGYAMASGEILEGYKEFGVNTSGQSKMIGGGLNLTYILGGGAILFVIYTEISKLFK